ncbi:probable protein phosphatase 2C 21 [Lytechinus variegatus]|uniref:probable protein phosphatase 2C 21 n=1 Tax=Lytechinus variegatus TaxID=7654 RepID=UPI001BB25ABF|nr:probable protein phosphatase 2C 21 [Lytechinus variegatus]
MGAYLSEPNVEKISDDGTCGKLSYGASAMQGWRVGMEDAHNCITQLTDDTSLFAVYDGHGGAEVAVYTAQQFPKLLTNLKSFKDGDINAALEEAFMTFDASLKQKAIIEKLRRIAGMEEGEEKEEDGETEALLEEAELPLEQLVARYCSQPSKSKRAKIKQAHASDLLSPMIQKKQPRFPLTAVNGSIQDGDGPVPNKTVPFDEEGDVVSKGKGDDETVDSVNGPGGDRRREGENGTDSDDDDDMGEGGDEKKGSAEIGEGEGSSENGSLKTEVKEEEAGSSGNSGSHNGDVQQSDTKESGSSSSGSSTDSKPKLVVPPYLDDDDDSDEEDEDYRSGDDEDEEEDDEEDDDEEEEEGDFDVEGEEEGDEEDEEEDYRMALPAGKEEPGSDSGSTAVVALLRGKTLTVANIGDSRCVLSRDGKALDMSYDHKPEDDIELRRIEKAGGKVTPDGRVNGGLNLSRAFGDHCYKLTTSLPPEEQMISAFPDIQTVTLTDQDDFMVVACDGIWNAMTSQEVIDFVRSRLENSVETDQTNKLSKICEELFDFCLAPDTSGDGTGCDNMTCVIVQFHSNNADSLSGATVGGKRKSAEDKPTDTDSKKPRH